MNFFFKCTHENLLYLKSINTVDYWKKILEYNNIHLLTGYEGNITFIVPKVPTIFRGNAEENRWYRGDNESAITRILCITCESSTKRTSSSPHLEKYYSLVYSRNDYSRPVNSTLITCLCLIGGTEGTIKVLLPEYQVYKCFIKLNNCAIQNSKL
jgi:hypothetical protein